ncbi:DUF5339 domain-containing protein [Rodentibacter trehalosifermentans]|uniref:Recombinase XerD n=1 Tax=Rodentibacter trehalosifermentans TaxID=1908263 RepID=A0A1V3J4T0_9PAST|nr:DUF5339 domain-containing protein [Rodentibacter trehalosifermentans]OOF46490.1 recombinase XerD [Rodentibacter trehalosifermentans]OOF49856.1 recombinase XerD [Rodentibacter trehalosifermentans]OOF52693.1 recombinase XerD [Rodentibacter trehalosifermentans]
MKKISIILTALFSAVSFSTLAAPQKTVETLPEQCAQLFKETENLIAQAEKQPGTHTQVSKIKNKLNQSKKQILEMELATQLKSCNIGLAKLNNMKSYSEDAH